MPFVACLQTCVVIFCVLSCIIALTFIVAFATYDTGEYFNGC